jgi:hypothetical protein
VNFFDGGLDGPVAGLGLTFWPCFGADFSGSVGIGFDVGFKMIPGVGLDWEFDRLLDALMVLETSRVFWLPTRVMR